jgi:glycosyltransferase involved in cell wall biosynthesis
MTARDQEPRSTGEAAAPRVTVILPTHDRAAFVRRAVDSLLAQSLSSWELRAVVDGATDGTAELLDELAAADARIHVHRHPANEGLGAALNTGLRRPRRVPPG